MGMIMVVAAIRRGDRWGWRARGKRMWWCGDGGEAGGKDKGKG